jgi:hypothetical protein
VRADIDGKNVLFSDAKTQKLKTSRSPEVEEIFLRMIGDGRKQRAGKASSGIEIPDVFPDLIATAAYARPESCQKGSWVDAVSPQNSPNRFLQDLQARSFPAAVDRGDDARLLIHKKNRETVGRLDDKENAGEAGDQGISPEALPRHFVDEVNDIGMDLLEQERTEPFPHPASFKVFSPPIAVPETVPQERDALQLRDSDDRRTRGLIFHGRTVYIIRFMASIAREHASLAWNLAA